ncbi:hypothetical protein [Alkalicoccus luteus]|uniref:Uncharacterized protein n=1 Tax=Alkalicoccus luteus TaxID=1237094 RepID=A0A969PN05_9BACI|nr:hypothetical protein [Alkalicoccus luteus]NJP37197.1 hypothetical protein [Alkalicoccus luteus]
MGYQDRSILTDANGLPIPQMWDEESDQFIPYPKVSDVKLTGRNVIKRRIIDQQEIRNTSSFASDKIDTSDFQSFSIYARSTLDQDVKLIPIKENEGTGRTALNVWDGEMFKLYGWSSNDIHAKIPGNTLIYHLDNVFPEIIAMPNFSIQARCDTAPTSGFIVVWIEGVPA